MVHSKTKFVAPVSHYPDANGNEVPGTEKFATKEEYDAWKAAQSNSGKLDENVVVTSIADVMKSITDIFKPAAVTNNTTNNDNRGNNDNKGGGNTMLYIGIGAAVLVLIIILVLVLKK